MCSQPQYKLLDETCDSSDGFSDWDLELLHSVCAVEDSYFVQEEFESSGVTDSSLYCYMEPFEEGQQWDMSMSNSQCVRAMDSVREKYCPVVEDIQMKRTLNPCPVLTWDFL